jgi:16S rRNA (guanine527-N7)-methyltransferase
MKQTEREQFLETFPVSHETLTKLDKYVDLLTDWNQNFNLVAESTLPHIWQRHFLDSAQLIQHIPKYCRLLIDIGSGAGFPGIVLAIMGIDGVHLTESIGKKAKFLQKVIDDLGLDVVLHHDRVENLVDMRADVITARAVALLPKLMAFAKPVTKSNTICLFLKGKNCERELTESAKSWTFDHTVSPSLSDDSGSVLIVRHIKAKNVPKPKRHK